MLVCVSVTAIKSHPSGISTVFYVTLMHTHTHTHTYTHTERETHVPVRSCDCCRTQNNTDRPALPSLHIDSTQHRQTGFTITSHRLNTTQTDRLYHHFT